MSTVRALPERLIFGPALPPDAQAPVTSNAVATLPSPVVATVLSATQASFIHPRIGKGDFGSVDTVWRGRLASGVKGTTFAASSAEVWGALKKRNAMLSLSCSSFSEKNALSTPEMFAPSCSASPSSCVMLMFFIWLGGSPRLG